MDEPTPNLGVSRLVSCRLAGGGRAIESMLYAVAPKSQCASMVSVCLDLSVEDSDYPPAPATQRGAFTALVSFGNGNGEADSVEVDWKRGTQFALVTSVIRIRSRCEHFDDPESLLRAKLSAFIAWGSGSHTFATVTRPTLTIPAGGSGLTLIPRHACELQIAVGGDFASTTAVWLSGPTLTSYPLGAFPAIPAPLAAYVPNGARSIAFLNKGPGPDPVVVTPIFRLSL